MHSVAARYVRKSQSCPRCDDRPSLPEPQPSYAYLLGLYLSADIRDLFTDALDSLRIAWRCSKNNTVSVTRREAVARLDEFVGPKY
jgi:hypothetical protein